MTTLSAFSNGAEDILRLPLNLSEATLGNNIRSDLNGLGDIFGNLLSGDVVGQPTLSSTQLSMSFAGGGTLAVGGSGFLGSAPVVTSVRLGSDATHFLSFSGALNLGLNSETISGTVTTLTYQTPSFSATLKGSMSLFIGDPDGPGGQEEHLRIAGSLTGLTAKSGGISVDVGGNLTFNTDTGEFAGTVNTINISDLLGGKVSLTGISVPVETLSGLTTAGEILDLVLAGNDVLTADLLGGARLDGQGGNDSITGGRGNDVLRGGEGNDTISGAAGNDLLDGGIGNDVLNSGTGNDSLAGGLGDDLYILDSGTKTIFENPNNVLPVTYEQFLGGGIDTVRILSGSRNLDSNVENLELAGTATNGNGNSLANRITGNSLANSLTGGLGSDTLEGLGGSDTMAGGAGNDTYVVTETGDVVQEVAGDTGDVLVINRNTTLTGAMFEHIEHLTLSGAAATGTGNAANNIITGNASANTLNGGTGTDTLIGGAGADTYLVDSSDDVVQETLTGATGAGDLVIASASFSLSANVENLTLLGAAGNSTGVGNAERNVITGNEFNNTLNGLGANDTLTGNAGDDTLDGGGGNDSLVGGAGSDLYMVDSSADIVSEALAGAAGGLGDEVLSSANFTLGLNVEYLTLTGSANIHGTGSASANVIAGNGGANSLTGGLGNDTLIGNEGADTLDGGAGNDLLSGDSGDDVYLLDAAADVISETGGGADTARILYNVAAPTTITVGTGNFVGIENVVVLGTGVFQLIGDSSANALTGNTLNDTLIGGDGNDTLSGGTGADRMYGGDGNDVYIVDNATDRVADGTLQSFEVELASAPESGENTSWGGMGSLFPTISGDGDLIVFQSNTQNFTSSNTHDGLWLKEMGSGELTRLGNVTPSDTSGPSTTPLISADGSRVVFQTSDTNWVTDGGPLVGNIYYVNVSSPNGSSPVAFYDAAVDAIDNGAILADISADGRYVVFGSTNAAFLDAIDESFDHTGIVDAIVVADLSDGSFKVASDEGVALVANNIGAFGGSGISDDGRYVVFNSAATNLVTGDSNAVRDVFVRDMDDEGTTAMTRVSTSSAGGQANGISTSVDISADGRYVLFDSAATNLVAGDTNAKVDVFVKDRVTGTTTRVSTSSAGVQGNQNSEGVGISADGRFVLFTSLSTTLVAADTDAQIDVYVRDMTTGEVALISRNSAGAPMNGIESYLLSSAAISADGRYISVGASAAVLPGDVDSAGDIMRIANPFYVIPGGGVDRVESSISYTLGADIENLTLTGTALTGIGNAQANVLTGNGSANTLIGGLGNDTLIGGAGADTYVVDSSADVVQETIAGAAGGVDQVLASANFTLSDNVENLTLVAGATGAITGTGNAERNVITGNDGINMLNGLGANDTLIGNGGADTLDGGTGNDSMVGGAGNDLYYVDSTTDIVSETLAGTAGGLEDMVQSTASFTLGVNIENLVLLGSANVNGTGNASANVMTGNGGANSLTGAAGNDTLSGGFGNDTLDGGLGNDNLAGGYGDDLFVLDSKDDVITEEGTNTTGDTARILYNAPAPNTIITLGTTLNFTAIEHVTVVGSGLFHLTGNGANNALTGNGSANSLTGAGGDDTLDGGGLNDTMVGDSGNDTYVVDHANDVVSETGSDTDDVVVINRTASLTTFTNIEHMTLSGSGAINATGNESGNILKGNAGANVLNGGAGNDTMAGGAGADTYVVDSGGDQVQETIAGAAGGVDLVNASTSFTLSDNVENLTLAAGVSGAIAGTGNAERNVITGNDFNNYLTGLGANDTLTGNGGDDTLDGGTGNDSMVGGAGNDCYIVDSTVDIASETLAGTAGGLADMVQSTASFTLGLNLENLTLIGSANANGTGNTQANIITGNDAANSLAGGAGNDTLQGNSGADTLDGGAGIDSLIGGHGNDMYVLDAAGDIASESGGSGVDTARILYSVTVATPITLGTGIFSGIENVVVVGTGAFHLTGDGANNALTGNGSANSLIGAGGDDTLDGGGLNDTMVGGGGNDTYFVDHATDVVTETAGDTDDVLVINRSATLATAPFAEIEHLTLTGTGAFTATGNAAHNILTGNSGANTLNGGAGNDTMSGNAGNDTYVVDSSGDFVQETIAGAAGGVDLVNASASFMIFDNVENLTLLGTANLFGFGNAERNVITGNAGNNLLSGSGGNDTLAGNAGADTLDGGTGNDSLVGGAGDDLYVVDSTTDVVSETVSGAGAGFTDTVKSAANWSLGANLENLVLTGSGNINGTGNALDNLITGNSGNNLLSGLDGNDTIDGGDGGDTILGGARSDFLAGGNGNDRLLGETGNDMLFGDAGDDTLDGGMGENQLYGGIGNDTYFVRSTDDQVLEFGADSSDTVITSLSSVNLGSIFGIENVVLTGVGTAGVTGNADANQLTGNDFYNYLFGQEGDDTLKGMAGDDLLDGADGNDALEGGAGNDTLIGGVGNDVFTGGDGADRFQFDAPWDASDVETITDFNAAADMFALAFSSFGGLDFGPLGASQFVSGVGAAAQNTDASILYETGSGELYYDPDGSQSGDRVLIAVLEGAPQDLTAANFLVY